MTWSGFRDPETFGLLVAGRKYDFSDFTRGQVVALCDRIGQIGEAADVELIAAPVDADLTDETGPGDEEPACCSAFIGILVAEGGIYGPEEVERETMLRALELARDIPAEVWERVDQEYATLGGKHPGTDIALRLGCIGPLPMAYLAFGASGAEDEGTEGTFVCGQDMEQNRHETGVRGLLLASCSYDGSGAEEIDVGEAAHAERDAKFSGGKYYLIASYD